MKKAQQGIPLQPNGDFLVKMSLRGYEGVEVQQYHTETGPKTIGFYDQNGEKRMFLSENAITELPKREHEVTIIDLNRIEKRPHMHIELL